jgi:hypothetical protein
MPVVLQENNPSSIAFIQLAQKVAQQVAIQNDKANTNK